MPRAGRPKKPAKLHKLNGNPSRLSKLDEIIEAEPKPAQLMQVSAPLLIANDEIAFMEWKRIVPELSRLGLLTCLDQGIVEMCCKAYSRWYNAELQMDSVNSTIFSSTNKNGEGYMQPLPQVGIATKYFKVYQACCSELGLSPSSRTRLGAQQIENAKDEFAEYLNSKMAR